MSGTRDFERRLELIERSVRAIEAADDAGLRATAQQLVQAVLELHAESLERLLDIVHASGEPGQDIIDRLGRDGVVSKLLLLHSLHPLALDARVIRALDAVRPTLQLQHGDVELLGIAAGRVRVRVIGNAAVAPVVERAILDAAPDVAGIDVDGAAAPAVVGFVSLDSLRATDRQRHAQATGAALAAVPGP